MKNIQMTVKGNKLVIEVDMTQSQGASASGKSEIFATTKGNKSIPGTDLKIGLNIYKPLGSGVEA